MKMTPESSLANKPTTGHTHTGTVTETAASKAHSLVSQIQFYLETEEEAQR